jgi:lipoate-protein ligase A
MLIDADLHALRNLLRVGTANIESKSIASVSSPVRNLEEWSAMIDHDSFVEAVCQAFARENGIPDEQVKTLDAEELQGIEEVRAGAEELKVNALLPPHHC